jgi:hypothetical protein
LADVAERIGDRHLTVQRLYGGYILLEQAEKAKVWDRNDRKKKHFAFSHLYTGLSYEGFKQYLGITDQSLHSPDPVDDKNLKHLGQLCVWLYGSKRYDQDPVIRSQNPDLRMLDEVLKSPQAVDALIGGLPLELAHDVSLGDERIFRDSLLRAKQAIQRARATMSTGYNGETDLLQTAEDIMQTVDDLCEDMRNKLRPRRRAKDKGRTADD